MPDTGESVHVAVVGGGVAGLTVAWRAAGAGLTVALLERDELGSGASRVAAGMLAPVAETEFGPAGERALELGLRSAAMWDDFAAELSRASERPLPLNTSGTMLIARDGDEARELERQIALRERLGLSCERLRGSEARELEPALAPGVRLGLLARDDHSVDPRALLASLRGACERSGVVLREHAPVAAVELEGGGGAARRRAVRGVRLADGSSLGARSVVLAAGAWSGSIELPAGASPQVRPVKGQILRLRDQAGPGLLTRAIRYEGGYIVPRGDGRYVLGATVEERGFDASPTAGGVYELLRAAREAVPGVLELELEEVSVGFRPGTPDNLPSIGRGPVNGLVLATGHYRNGILLAPLTGRIALDALGIEAVA
ncbi:MAG: glycine oxidase ThiO [Solirubrobacteraceae bacterium]